MRRGVGRTQDTEEEEEEEEAATQKPPKKPLRSSLPLSLLFVSFLCLGIRALNDC